MILQNCCVETIERKIFFNNNFPFRYEAKIIKKYVLYMIILPNIKSILIYFHQKDLRYDNKHLFTL